MHNDLTELLLTNPLYGEAGMRELEQRALAAPGLGAGALMERAGAAVFAAVRRHYPTVRRLGVLCGPGNNGGDGLVLARLARAAGYTVTLHAPETAPAAADALHARAAWLDCGGQVRSLATMTLPAAELWVDCLFGIGLRRALAEPYTTLVERLNHSGLPVLAVDVPSGLDSNTGTAPGIAVRATRTLTMLADKAGLHTGVGVDYAGVVEVASLAVPVELQRGVLPRARRLPAATVARLLPTRRRGAHKGDSGHVLVLGGAPGYSGAGLLCALAALRAGAGRVTLATHPEHAAYANVGCPELMVRAVADGLALRPLLSAVDSVAVGPGLGQAAWGRELWLSAADSSAPVVADADALNLLARAPRRRSDWVLTPHPGEAARLLGWSPAQIEADRFSAVEALQLRFGGTVVLKGAGTLVLGPERDPPVCVTGGHSGMATAGMGDVLTGIIAALRAQGQAPAVAAAVGAAWHAAAATHAAEVRGGTIGILAGEVAAALPACRGMMP